MTNFSDQIPQIIKFAPHSTEHIRAAVLNKSIQYTNFDAVTGGVDKNTENDTQD